HEEAPSRALLIQRSELARVAGHDDEAHRFRVQAEAAQVQTPADLFWDVVDRVDRPKGGDLDTVMQNRRAIMATLQYVSNQDLQNFVNYLLLGNCYKRLGQLDAAVSSYSTGIALQPDLPWAYINRGLAHLDLKDYPSALADFDKVIALRPD